MRRFYRCCQCTTSCTNKYVVFGFHFLCLKWKNQDVIANYCTAICSVFLCARVVLFMSSTSGNQSPNILNGAIPVGGVLSMGVVENARMNKAQAPANAAAPVATNVINNTLPDGVGLSMGVVSNVKMNKERSVTDAAAPVEPNVFNDALPSDSGLSMVVAKNT